MTDRYVEPVPSVEDVREGDVLELDGELYVALEDGQYVGDTKPYADEGEEYTVRLRGAEYSETICNLSERPATDDRERQLFLWKEWDLGYKERPRVDEFDRCFRTDLSVSTDGD